MKDDFQGRMTIAFRISTINELDRKGEVDEAKEHFRYLLGFLDSLYINDMINGEDYAGYVNFLPEWARKMAHLNFGHSE